VNDDRTRSVAQSSLIQFRRYKPSLRLSPFVRNFWTVRCDGTLVVPRRHRVVPDGCIDLIFLRRAATEQYRAFVVGTMTRPIVEELVCRADYLGVRFAPGGFRRFFQTPPADLTDRIVPLDDLSASSALADRLAECRDLPARLETLETDLGRRYRPDERNTGMAKIFEMVSACRGNVPIAQLGRMAGWSPRHLRRMFHESIGIAPKTFCRIMRFLEAFRVLRRRPRAGFLEVALDAGYYDQAHFIHEFGDFYGSSPSTMGENSAF
jgi:AraC-like DNA-binding protein